MQALQVRYESILIRTETGKQHGLTANGPSLTSATMRHLLNAERNAIIIIIFPHSQRLFHLAHTPIKVASSASPQPSLATLPKQRQFTALFSSCRPHICQCPTLQNRIFFPGRICCNTYSLQSDMVYQSILQHDEQRDRPGGTPPPGELNTRGVVKYSDFGPIDGYISETVEDGR